MTEIEAVRLPRLLKRETEGDGYTLRETGRLRPAALSAELNLTPLSHAEMTLEEDDLPLRVHDLVEIFGQNGSLGIFRVARIETTYRKQRRIRLNHALDLLADAVLPGEETVSGTAAQVISRVLSAQAEGLDGAAFWTVGTVEDEAEYSFENRYTNALQCLTDLARAREDYDFAFDFSGFPWKLHFLRRDEAVLTEFRLSRNVERCQVALDDSELCTRLYLSVNIVTADENGEKSEITHEVYNDAAAQDVWGIVERTAGVSAAEVPDRAEWARRYFARYAQPALQITVDGLELNRITGERLDEMRLGRLCRVALPDYNAVFSARILSVRYPDILRQPWRATVEMANKRLRASGAFASLTAWRETAARTMAGTEREVRENRYSLTAQDRHITAQGEILHRAGIEIDPHGVWLFAGEDRADYALGAAFKIQADAITAEVDARAAGQADLSTRITQTAGEVTSLASKTGVNSLGQNETLYSRISQNATSITSEVTARVSGDSSLSSLIEQNASSIRLKASQVTVDALRTDISNLKTGATTAGTIRVTNLVVGGNGCSWFHVTAENGVFKLLGTYD
ncbi:MAG: phage tail protein [Clostridia bacterium]|nr:phage tail protein [Clostridia bacterium]